MSNVCNLNINQEESREYLELFVRVARYDNGFNRRLKRTLFVRVQLFTVRVSYIHLRGTVGTVGGSGQFIRLRGSCERIPRAIGSHANKREIWDRSPLAVFSSNMYVH